MVLETFLLEAAKVSLLNRFPAIDFVHIAHIVMFILNLQVQPVCILATEAIFDWLLQFMKMEPLSDMLRSFTFCVILPNSK